MSQVDADFANVSDSQKTPEFDFTFQLYIFNKCTKKTIPCFSEVCTVQGVVTLESPVEWCLPGGVCFLEPVNEKRYF